MRQLARVCLFALCIVMCLALLSGCMPGSEASIESEKPAGFLLGVWHGWIAPLSLIFSLGENDIRIYEVYNVGFWYDFGFYIAIISGFGGLSLTRSRKDKD